MLQGGGSVVANPLFVVVMYCPGFVEQMSFLFLLVFHLAG